MCIQVLFCVQVTSPLHPTSTDKKYKHDTPDKLDIANRDYNCILFQS